MPDKKNENGHLRKIIRKTHLILGFTTGLIVFIVAVTGCLWVFQEEIKNFIPDTRIVAEENKPLIVPTRARKIAETIFPDKHIHGVLYGDRDEAIEVIFYEAEPEFYRSVFLNPYHGKIIKTEDHLAGFFAFVLDGHLNLWLPQEVGSRIVSWSTLIFVLMLITGIILWWPRNKRNKKQRFWFNWKSTTKWKRKNYDLHSIAGFYASVIALLIAYTGLVMAFDWFEKGTYKALGGDKLVVFTIPENTSQATNPGEQVELPIDQLYPLLKAGFPHAEQFEIHYPATDSAGIYVEITYERGVYYSSDYRFYDQYTLEELETPSLYGVYGNTDFADKIIRMIYDIHVGAILGLPGKILAFFASLLVASLPVTGFMIWLGRRKKATAKKYKALNNNQGKETTHYEWTNSTKSSKKILQD